MSTNRYAALVLRRLGCHLADAGRFEEAENAALASLEQADDDPVAWVLLGSVRAQLKRYAEAVDPYVQALKRNAADISTWTNLGELYISLLDFDKAAAALRQAMLLDPTAIHPAGRRARVVVASTLRKLQARS